MRQVTRKGLITMAAAGGVLALGGGYAHADAGAAGGASNSPGVLSGNSIQVPVDVPVNVCGNSVNAGGLLNPTSGNDCGNSSAGAAHERGTDDGAASGQGSVSQASGSPAASGHGSASSADGAHGAGSEAREAGAGTGRHRASSTSARAVTADSPGILSGNQVQAPVEIPVNLCGNSITIGGLLNPVFGNSCENDTQAPPPVVPQTPQTPHTPVKPAVPHTPQAPEPQLVPGEHLAQTGADGLGVLVPASAGLLLAGAGTVLYRRSRSAA
ncbi:chaplin [Streptomyces sp. NPDC020403]|uniref:chaplin n=1 Tax=unclassified Streptomyces TaxID=2593676 RepID=UPI0034001D10